LRLMLSRDGGRTLQPFIHMHPERVDPLVIYIAARYTGYWAEAAVTLTKQPSAALDATNRALASMIAGLRPGMSGKDVAALAEPHRHGLHWHPVLGENIGYGVGLALEEGHLRRDDANPAIVEGGVYSLQAGFCDHESGAAFLSAMVRMNGARAVVMYRPRVAVRR
jgi:hypothetical protein